MVVVTRGAVVLYYTTKVDADLLISGVRTSTGRRNLSCRVFTATTSSTSRGLTAGGVSIILLKPRIHCLRTSFGGGLRKAGVPLTMVSVATCNVVGNPGILRRTVSLVGWEAIQQVARRGGVARRRRVRVAVKLVVGTKGTGTFTIRTVAYTGGNSFRNTGTGLGGTSRTLIRTRGARAKVLARRTRNGRIGIALLAIRSRSRLVGTVAFLSLTGSLISICREITKLRGWTEEALGGSRFFVLGRVPGGNNQSTASFIQCFLVLVRKG